MASSFDSFDLAGSPVKPSSSSDILEQVGEAHGERIDLRKFLLELDADLFRVFPGDFFCHARSSAASCCLLAFGERQRLAFGDVVAVPLGNLDDVVAGFGDDCLAAEAGVELRIGGHVEAVEFVVFGFADASAPASTQIWQVVQAQEPPQAWSRKMPKFSATSRKDIGLPWWS